ncbi:MAG: helix-turn-helix transcriptional regulator [Alphaproteobacteria bacterium]|nr:helix-turn-helix transcriptional regulator [Alphaproteobacteria bacterium]
MDTKINKKKTISIDHHVGARIRERRVSLNLSQQELAKLIGVTFQQAHKYEKGINRVSAGRLFDIAKCLGTTVDFFFEGLSHSANCLTNNQRRSLEIMTHFSMIKDESHQEALSNLARALSDNSKKERGEG